MSEKYPSEVIAAIWACHQDKLSSQEIVESLAENGMTVSRQGVRKVINEMIVAKDTNEKQVLATQESPEPANLLASGLGSKSAAKAETRQADFPPIHAATAGSLAEQLGKLRLSANSITILEQNHFLEATDLQYLTAENLAKLQLPIRDFEVLKRHIFGSGQQQAEVVLPPPVMLTRAPQITRFPDHPFAVLPVSHQPYPTGAADQRYEPLSPERRLPVEMTRTVSIESTQRKLWLFRHSDCIWFCQSPKLEFYLYTAQSLRDSGNTGAARSTSFLPRGTFKVMLLGETGAGKSTLVNYIANIFQGGSVDDLKFAIPTQHWKCLPAGSVKHSEQNLDDPTRSGTGEWYVEPRVANYVFASSIKPYEL